MFIGQASCVDSIYLRRYISHNNDESSMVAGEDGQSLASTIARTPERMQYHRG